MSSLVNLIPDPTTPNLWQCRPAATKRVDFTRTGGQFNASQFSTAFATGFLQPIGLISTYIIVGDFAFGLIATARNAGKDEPFCINLLTNQAVTVSGITNANTPLSPAATGAWTPPTMAAIGPKLMVTHPGFNTAGGIFVGQFDISNPAAPAWSAGNMGGLVTFTVAPSAVAQFNNRAWYVHNVAAQPALIFSDPLAPLNATNANQVLTFGDNVPLTALGGLPLNNQLGGVIQSLIVFKGVKNVYQITGDAATNNLAQNALNIATGTLAPNALCTTPKGLAFIAPDGLRVIDFNARVSDPIGISGSGVNAPFIFTFIPSRMAAGCNGSIYRVSLQNGAIAGQPAQEYWYDFTRQIWHGPHSFPAALYQPYQGTFLVAGYGVSGALWQTDVQQSLTSGFVENGVQLTYTWATPKLPDLDDMVNHAMTESTLDLGLASGVPPVVVIAQDGTGAVLDTVSVSAPTTGTIWGAFTWGQALWGGASAALAAKQLPWHFPLVFEKLQIQVNGQSAQNVRIGTLHLRYQKLRYQTSTVAA